MKETIKGIIILVIVMFMALMINKEIRGQYKLAKYFKNEIVEVPSARVLQENEGKLVLITGRIKSDAILKFEEQGVEIQSPLLERSVRMYQYLYADKNKDRVLEGWGSDKPRISLKDPGLQSRYTNPVPEIKSEKLMRSFKVGDFQVESKGLNNIKPNADIVNFESREGLYQNENILFTSNSSKSKVGDLAMNFGYLDLNIAGEYTFVGVQRNGSLLEYKTDFGENGIAAQEGRLTKEDFVKLYSKTPNTIMWMTFPFLAFISIFLIINLIKDIRLNRIRKAKRSR